MRGGAAHSRAARYGKRRLDAFRRPLRGAHSRWRPPQPRRQALHIDRHFTGTATTSWARPLKARRNPPCILGCKRAADDDERPLRFVFQLRHRLRERVAGVLIVAAIEPDLRASWGERRHMALGEDFASGRATPRAPNLLRRRTPRDVVRWRATRQLAVAAF